MATSRKTQLQQQGDAFRRLLHAATGTEFAKDHRLDQKIRYPEYRKTVPVRKYEDFQRYWGLLADGKSNILRPGFPEVFGLSSGTTSGAKRIPLTRRQVTCTVRRTARAFFEFLWNERTLQPFSGKLFYLSAPAKLEEYLGRPSGLLSAVSQYHLPFGLTSRRLPTLSANREPDRSTRKKRLIEELLSNRITFFSGTPPWMVDLLDECEKVSGRPVAELFPELRCIGSGGTAMSPYVPEFSRRFSDRKLHFFETFAATEGLIGFRPKSSEPEFALDAAEIFYEFIPARELGSETRRRYDLSEVEVGVDYAIALSTESGLFSYLLGDVIRFVSVDPFRFVIRGRTENHLNRYGEHLLGSELEGAVAAVARNPRLAIGEFTALDTQSGYRLFYEESVSAASFDPTEFAGELDRVVSSGNPLFGNARRGGIAPAIEVRGLPRGFLLEFLERSGRVPGQAKVPRILNSEVTVRGFLSAVAEIEIGGARA